MTGGPSGTRGGLATLIRQRAGLGHLVRSSLALAQRTRRTHAPLARSLRPLASVSPAPLARLPRGPAAERTVSAVELVMAYPPAPPQPTAQAAPAAGDGAAVWQAPEATASPLPLPAADGRPGTESSLPGASLRGAAAPPSPGLPSLVEIRRALARPPTPAPMHREASAPGVRAGEDGGSAAAHVPASPRPPSEDVAGVATTPPAPDAPNLGPAGIGARTPDVGAMRHALSAAALPTRPPSLARPQSVFEGPEASATLSRPTAAEATVVRRDAATRSPADALAPHHRELPNEPIADEPQRPPRTARQTEGAHVSSPPVVQAPEANPPRVQARSTAQPGTTLAGSAAEPATDQESLAPLRSDAEENEAERYTALPPAYASLADVPPGAPLRRESQPVSLRAVPHAPLRQAPADLAYPPPPRAPAGETASQATPQEPIALVKEDTGQSSRPARAQGGTAAERREPLLEADANVGRQPPLLEADADGQRQPAPPPALDQSAPYPRQIRQASPSAGTGEAEEAEPLGSERAGLTAIPLQPLPLQEALFGAQRIASSEPARRQPDGKTQPESGEPRIAPHAGHGVAPLRRTLDQGASAPIAGAGVRPTWPVVELWREGGGLAPGPGSLSPAAPRTGGVQAPIGRLHEEAPEAPAGLPSVTHVRRAVAISELETAVEPQATTAQSSTTPPAPARPTEADTERLVEEVYRRIRERLRVERERHGGVR